MHRSMSKQAPLIQPRTHVQWRETEGSSITESWGTPLVGPTAVMAEDPAGPFGVQT
jgi:hypothetical protein